MKILTVFCVGICAVISAAIWQASKLGALDERERQLVMRPAPVAAHETLLSASPQRVPVSAEKLASFTSELHSLQRVSGRPGENAFYSTLLRRADLCETLAQLSSAQLREVVDALAPTGADSVREVMSASGILCPRSTLEVVAKMGADERGKFMLPASYPAFQNWLDADPKGLFEWFREKQFADVTEKNDHVWGFAAAAIAEPSAENMARLLALPDSLTIAGHVVSKLPDAVARISFFRALHQSTKGNSEGVGFYSIVNRFVRHTPFAQAAHVADATPPFGFRTEKGERFGGIDMPEANGSLRYNIAVLSDDGTVAERWNWLVSREVDRPSEIQLDALIRYWCARDYSEVATWVRSLPAGRERESIRRALHKYVSPTGKEIAAEWETP
jgi:hypothetical protein